MMIVPNFWAEARVQYRRKGKQITVRRFGWSDASQEEAQNNAQARADEALKRAVSGEPLPRRERKVPYNGGNGLPIREEVVARHGETVITRNSYGARCLNTPDVLFADIDFREESSTRTYRLVALVMFAAVIGLGHLMATAGKGLGAILTTCGVATFFGLLLAIPVSNSIHRMLVRAKGGPEAIARANILRFMEKRPDWLVHVYRTPAGMRMLVTHRLFDPQEAEVADCFRELDTDPVYVAMCLNQHCFRARLSAKPWRIGVEDRLKPRRGVWPVPPEKLSERRAWLERYDHAAEKFAACRYVESFGKGVSVPAALAVRQLHDDLCKATSGLPIA